jgi:hypothetical protein
VNKLTVAAAFALALLLTPAAHAAFAVTVPEPSVFAMLGSGLLALGGLRFVASRRK